MVELLYGLKFLKTKTLLIIFFLVLGFAFARIVFAQTETPTPTPNPESSNICTSVPECADQKFDCSKCVEYLTSKKNDASGKVNTLSSEISVMDNQIKLTEARVRATEQQIKGLEKDIDIAKDKVGELQNNINRVSKVLIGRITAVYQVGTIRPWEIFLTANNIGDVFNRLKYLRIVQIYDKKQVYAAEQAKIDYKNQKQIYEDKANEAQDLSKKLANYNNELASQKVGKQSLLSVTRNDETRYQSLLAQAKAQISGFKSFASSQGGATILPPQPSPDGWFYNQRDERWGRNNIGASGEQIWEVGCLVTSTAMVMKKHGEGVTPADVAGNSSYFFSNTAYMLIPWISGKISSVWGADLSSIDSKLSSGEVVIVGLRAGALGMHFVVLKSGSAGNYIMNDPWNGPDLKFSDYYSTGQIFQYGYYRG